MTLSSPAMAQSQSLRDWLSYLEQIHPQTIELGLERVGTVARRLGVDHLAMPVILVGGTNGKGTTCAMLESIYREAGYQVGVYSSPHLVRYNERVRIDGQDIDDDALCAAFAAVEQARESVSLTFFEFGTLAALWIFQSRCPDVVILEVGLGGRLDATNIISADVAVITSIALDHCDWLGHDRGAIGREKAGICRSGRPLVCGEPDAPETIAQVAQSVGATLLQLGEAFTAERQAEQWSFRGCHHHWQDLPFPVLPWQNAVTALAVLEQMRLPVTEQQIRRGLLQARLSGRMQLWQAQPRVLLDVAHNPHSAAYLASQLHQQPCRGRRLAVVGMLRDKDITHTLAEMGEVIDDWFLASLDGPRAASAEQLQAALLASGQCFASVADAYAAALSQAGAEDEIIVFGSFFTVAAIMAPPAV